MNAYTLTPVKERPSRRSSLAGFLLLLVPFSAILYGCGGNSDADAHESHDDHGGEEALHEDEHGHHAEEGMIALTPEMVQKAGITVEPLQRQSLTAAVTAPAVVHSRRNDRAHVGTIIPGRLTKLHVSEGSVVAAGAPLAEIETLEVGEARAEYLSAVAEEQRTTAALKRQEQLTGEQIGAERLLETARAEFEHARARRKAAEARLRTFNIAPEQADASFGNRLVLRAPISGIVARCSATPGEYVEPEQELFMLVNTATVWVDARLSPSAADGISVGDMAEVRGSEGAMRKGKVIFIAPTVDPETRTVTVRVEIPNRDRAFRPETYAVVEFTRAAEASGTPVPALPAGALEQENGRFYIYREHEPNVFERTEVAVGEQIGDMTVIAGGLNEGERVAVDGIFYLRSARKSGELSEHHH